MQKSEIRALIKLITSEAEVPPVLKKELAGVINTHPSELKIILNEDFKDGVPALINSLVEEVAWERLKNSFKNFTGKINPDLEEGLILLSQFDSIAPLKRNFNQKLDDLMKQLRPFIINCADALEVAEVLQKFLFGRLKMRCTEGALQMQHLSFNRFLQTGSGAGICIACLYYLTGYRYGIEINLVDVSGRILIKFEDAGFNQPFYVDPFDNGKILSRRDCVQFVLARGMQWQSGYEAPLNSRMIIKRFLSNMIFISNKMKDERKLKYLREYFSYFETV